MASTSESGLAERQQIIFENFYFIEGVCRRLPPHMCLLWGGGWDYRHEEVIEATAKQLGLTEQFQAALKKRRRGKRLVVIVAAGGVLYQFV